MKKAIIVAVFFTALGKLSAQPILTEEVDSVTPFYQVMDSIFQNVSLSSTRVPTGYLAEKAFLGQNLFGYNGTITDSTSVDAFKFQQMYNIMFTGNVGTGATLDFWDSIQSEFDEQITGGNIPIGIFAWQYDRIKPNAFDAGLLNIVNSRYLADPSPLPSTNPFFTDSAFAAAPCVTYIDTEDISFILPSSLVFENFPGSITLIKIDFGDGSGFRTITPDQAVAVHYSTEGNKTIEYEVYISGGTVLRGATTLYAPFFRKAGGFDLLNASFWPGFTSSENFMGKPGVGDVSIRLNCRNNNKLMKPFIIVPGIDPPGLKAFNDGKEGEDFETFLSNPPENTALINKVPDLNNFLLSEGYDLIYINYRDGGDFIQRNAQLLKSVIREVNRQKLINGSTEPNTVMGISMGGLVTRWALLEMEDASEMHDVENFISYDSPHNGANVPIAFQSMLNHVYDIDVWTGTFALGIPIFIPVPIRLFIPKLNEAEKVLACNAALQLLKHHTYSSSSYPKVPGEHSFRQTMMSFLDTKGFPSQVSSRGVQIKNTALINGSDNVTSLGIGNSSTFFTVDIEGVLVTPPIFFTFPEIIILGLFTHVETWSMPIAAFGKKRIYRGSYLGGISVGSYFATFIIASKKDEVENGNGIDNVPGSTQSISANTTGGKTSSLNRFGVFIPADRFTFLPSVNSTALKSPFRNNLEYDIDGNFDNILQNWANNESPMENYEVHKDGTPAVARNTSHTSWFPRASTFIQNLHVPAYSGTVGVISSNSPISSGEVYNYGQGTTNRLPFSNGLYTININGGSVKINSNEKVGYTPDLNNNNPSPPTGSTFKVFSSNSDECGGVTSIGISNGGQLIVGDNSVNNKGELYMREGSLIEILNGGILVIHNNSKLVIEEGATLIFNSGAQILLDGENAILEIRGTLKIMDGANFTFSKSSGVSKAGFIRFDLSHFTSGGIEVTGTTAEINLAGNNDPLVGWDKVLEIKGRELTTPDGSVTTPELAAFNVTTGWVEMVSGGSLGLSVPGNFSETYFSGSGAAGSETGIIVYTPASTSISECRFTQLERGVVLYMDNGYIGPYQIDNSTFDGNERGIEATEASLEIINCNFTNNTEYGVYANSLEGDCEFDDCGFSGNGTGMSLQSNASSPINCYVFHSGFDGNSVGISTTSSQKVNLTLECNKFSNNGEGVAAGRELNLSPTLNLGGHVGGDNVFYDNTSSSISVYYSLYLQSGNNSFINSSGSAVTLISAYGSGLITCSTYPCLFYQSSGVIEGGGNYWSGSFVNILYDASSNPLTISGPNNPSFTSSCFYIPSGMAEPQFVSTGLPPFSKHDYTMDADATEKGPELKVYPNPADNTVFIQTPTKEDNIYTVSIFDIAGKKLLSETFAVSNYATLTMPVGSLSSGTYFIKITTLDGTVNENRKIVILK